MPSLLERAAGAVGVKIQGGQIVLSEEQIQVAQGTVRKLLDMPTGDGKALSSAWQNWRIVGEPVLDKYGWKIGLAVGGVVAVGVVIGYMVAKK